ncbi:MAG: hypothetical protein K9H26_09300 [Prolixibacteraceae bacterium]|nr:hypothetical protein [Prolixibacteraceae bacterium]
MKEIEFLKKLTGVSSFTDARDGNVYSYITIDMMEWMAENLAYLPSVDSAAHESYTDPHYYVYDYDGDSVEEAQATENYETYGVLYNWAAAENACPSGWHLPDETEWSALIDYLIANGYNYDGSTSGNYIAKSMATSTGWSESSTAGAVGNTDYPDKRNKSGFSALPGGYRGTGGSFNNLPGWASWWSSEYNTERAYAVFFGSSYTGPNYGRNWNKLQGMSVRCVRD